MNVYCFVCVEHNKVLLHVSVKPHTNVEFRLQTSRNVAINLKILCFDMVLFHFNKKFTKYFSSRIRV